MILDTIKLENITVVKAERMVNKHNSKPGVVKATLDSKESKTSVMKHKNRLKDSSRYNKVYVENDLPATQRAINANFRTLLNAIGENNLHLRGSRISTRDGQQEYQRGENYPRRQYNKTSYNYDTSRSYEKSDYSDRIRERQYSYHNKPLDARRVTQYNN